MGVGEGGEKMRRKAGCEGVWRDWDNKLSRYGARWRKNLFSGIWAD